MHVRQLVWLHSFTSLKYMTTRQYYVQLYLTIIRSEMLK
uniref:Uncharacterized protein n=1 Tax=Arundo donax TaxID=35708 RepID=A0A0A9B390_ARUDO